MKQTVGVYLYTQTECVLLVAVREGVLINRASPFLIFLPEAREVLHAFSKAFRVFSLLFQQDRHCKILLEGFIW